MGVGIELVAAALERNFPELTLGIIDSDHIRRSCEVFPLIDRSDIILSTQMGALIADPRIASVIFPLFELNYSVPEYDFEESLYAQVSYIKKQKKPIFLQTFSPENPLIQELVFGNFRSYLEVLKKERRDFHYPPYVDFVTIRVHHRDQERVRHWIVALREMIAECDLSETFVASDTDIWEKHHGEWMQKIILKGKNVSDILSHISASIVKNRHIFVDWH